jgi:hypothetical protein
MESLTLFLYPLGRPVLLLDGTRIGRKEHGAALSEMHECDRKCATHDHDAHVLQTGAG